MASKALRYVPQGPVSLSSDAPGWAANQKNEGDQRGPACWKCKGTCYLPLLKKQKVGKGDATTDANAADACDDADAQQSQRTCPVCKGKGHLPIKSKLLQSQNESGVITSRRRRPRGWKEFGHIPPAVQASLASSDNNEHGNESDATDVMDHAISLLSQANGLDDDYDTKRKDVPITLPSSQGQYQYQDIPKWVPSNPGEQLCNLVGRWRILQRVASHRWTTDDLVTAYVAASSFVSSQTSSSAGVSADTKGGKTTIRYLDLGTGNASVLQMATWYLLSSLPANEYKLEAVGVEARSEAVGLARRSLSFNLGSVEHRQKVYTGGLDTNGTPSMEHDVQIVQGDFRNLVPLSLTNKELGEGRKDTAIAMEDVASRRYDLITGTPPYFRVGFTSSKNSAGGEEQTSGTDGNDDEVITSAVIEQGGMPTSMQSAPARCEFRGGIEAYCLAASAMLSRPHGRFAVCENWLNNDRVWKGAEEAGLAMECVWPVMGGVKKESNLFAVYVMKLKSNGETGGVGGGIEESCVRPSLIVRDENGRWTQEYSKVMEAMSIPVV